MRQLDFSYIGKRIRDIRTEKKYTQEYLANYTGVNVSHISNIETNKVKVSLTLLVNICNGLEVTVDYLLQEEYPIPTKAAEAELLAAFNNLDREKQNALIRIAKIL